jgi:glucose-6-phosphate 1-dehydrogenase
VVVFGASGDLAKKKTYPALFDLYKARSLPPKTLVVGYARSPMTDKEFRERLTPFLLKKADEKVVAAFLKHCVYRSGGYDDAQAMNVVSREASKVQMAASKTENRIFYLALPPAAFVSSCGSIKKGMMSGTGFNRVIVEKPFGHDTESAKKLGVDVSIEFKLVQ